MVKLPRLPPFPFPACFYLRRPPPPPPCVDSSLRVHAAIVARQRRQPLAERRRSGGLGIFSGLLLLRRVAGRQADRQRREAESTAAFLSSLHLQATRECTVRGEVCLRRSCSRGGVTTQRRGARQQSGGRRRRRRTDNGSDGTPPNISHNTQLRLLGDGQSRFRSRCPERVRPARAEPSRASLPGGSEMDRGE